MGIYHFKLPDIGEGIAEAEITVWHVAVGQVIDEDQSLVDVMTDKATVDLTSPVAGVVTAIHGAVGGLRPVGSVLVELEIVGVGNVTDTAQLVAAPEISTPNDAPQTQPASAVVVERQPAPSKAIRRSIAPATTDNRETPFAAPATRRRAFELGIPLQFVRGTGPAGRILSEDLDAHLATEGRSSLADGRYAARVGVADTPIVGIRRKIAGRLQEAKRRIPHITYVDEVDVTELEALRLDLNAHRTDLQPKLTMLPLLVRALVKALRGFGHLNATYDDDNDVLHTFDGVHCGIATQTPGGLMVPVIRHAETHNVWSMASEIVRLSQAARDGTATRDELSGSTITVTSLGPLGGITTTPIINLPEVAIIGPNKIIERPIVSGSFISIRKMMNLSSSFDHRIIDGYDAARFIQVLKRLLEHPALIFMDDV